MRTKRIKEDGKKQMMSKSPVELPHAALRGQAPLKRERQDEERKSSPSY
jgi:hypothetical protein